ncbi:hypothetical protein HG531_008747 [Fusarium graminearum]|nr:hypothetical protein HG531_008747 [Fusarium graminearum]
MAPPTMVKKSKSPYDFALIQIAKTRIAASQVVAQAMLIRPHAEPTVAEEQMELGALEETEDGADDVNNEDDDTENPVGPLETDISDNGPSRQGVKKTTKTRPSSRDTICERSTSSEPLRNNTNTRNKKKTHPETEQNTLCEEQLVDLGGKAGAYETSSFEDNAKEESWLGTKVSNAHGR